MPFSAGIRPWSRAQPIARNSSRPATARSRLRARGADLEIGIFDLESHRSAANLLLGDPAPDGLADPLQLGGERGFVGEVLEEGVLGADRLPRPVGLDLPVAEAAGEVVIIVAAGAEIVGEEGAALSAKVGAGDDSEARHLLRGLRADAVEARDRKRSDERLALARRHHAQAVRLVLVAGKLGEELVVGDPGRGGEAGLGADPGADLLGDDGGDADPLQVLGDVEIGLVERERLDQLRIVGEDRADLLGDGAIGIEARLDEDEPGAAALRARRGHGRADAIVARLVARRSDHAAHSAADRDRLAAQRRIVALLDRGVEGVHVDMDDLARDVVHALCLSLTDGFRTVPK